MWSAILLHSQDVFHIFCFPSLLRRIIFNPHLHLICPRSLLSYILTDLFLCFPYVHLTLPDYRIFHTCQNCTRSLTPAEVSQALQGNLDRACRSSTRVHALDYNSQYIIRVYTFFVHCWEIREFLWTKLSVFLVIVIVVPNISLRLYLVVETFSPLFEYSYSINLLKRTGNFLLLLSFRICILLCDFVICFHR